MFRPRLIPVLLLKNKGLVKTTKFRDPIYIGDPINAVKIFNERNADELIFLDITASKENRTIPVDLVKRVGDEAFMPISVGGGINTIEQAKEMLNVGAEKVVINTAGVKNPKVITEIAKTFGNQSIAVSIDVKKDLFGKYHIYGKSGSEKSDMDLVAHAKKMRDLGAGEIIINNIDNDGVMKGYDIELIKLISSNVDIPVVALGGAGNEQDFVDCIKFGKASAAAAGSMFVYYGKKKGILINYPERKDLEVLFKDCYL